MESGRHSNRQELTKALSHAKRAEATLVVAKLDRLARNVAFLSALIESGVRRTRTSSSRGIGQAYVDLLPQMKQLQSEGHSLRAIAESLNSAGHTTRRGKSWNQVQVSRVLQRLAIA